MIPQGGFTLVFHIALVAVFWIARKLHYVGKAGIRLPHSAVYWAPVIFLVIVVAAGNLLSTALADRPTYSYFLGPAEACPDTFAPLPEGPIAVLRIDDIQAVAWRDIQLRMIDDALARDMPPVLGVMPVDLESDRLLFSYLTRHRCDVEVALHGWDNLDAADGNGEFMYLSKEESRTRLDMGLEVLEKIRSDVHTFIPPENDMSEGALAALPEAGFTIMSSGNGRPDDFHATTYDYFHQRLSTPADVLSLCRIQFDKGRHCVIMMHPQDFADKKGRLDPEKYARYLAVLDTLEREQVSVVRFSDLYDTR